MHWSPPPATSSAQFWTVAESAAFDLHLQLDIGLSANLLMENAAANLACWIRELAAQESLKKILFLAGPGNNGADALVAARQLIGVDGLELIWLRPGPPAEPDSLLAQAERALYHLKTPSLPPTAPEALPECDLIIDGLFGVGLTRPLEGSWRGWAQAIDALPCPILAVDTPSGLDASSGEVLGACPAARWTLSFIGPKRGFLRGEGPAKVGELRCADIGVSRAYAEAWLGRNRTRG
jgi:hydroxyethylthiazole kinase-like uncharacterized protein yjeF